MFDGSKRYIDPFFYEMNENLTKTYIEVDKFIYENVPIESIATLQFIILKLEINYLFFLIGFLFSIS